MKGQGRNVELKMFVCCDRVDILFVVVFNSECSLLIVTFDKLIVHT